MKTTPLLSWCIVPYREICFLRVKGFYFSHNQVRTSRAKTSFSILCNFDRSTLRSIGQQLYATQIISDASETYCAMEPCGWVKIEFSARFEETIKPRLWRIVQVWISVTLRFAYYRFFLHEFLVKHCRHRSTRAFLPCHEFRTFPLLLSAELHCDSWMWKLVETTAPDQSWTWSFNIPRCE